MGNFCPHIDNEFCKLAEEICRQSAKPGQPFNPVLPSLSEVVPPVNVVHHFQIFPGFKFTVAKDHKKQATCTGFPKED